MKKLILLTSVAILCLLNVSESSADDEINCLTGQQSCGTNCCWSVENKKLTITGGADGSIGTMDDYDNASGGEGHNTQWTGLDIRAIYVSGLENIGIQAFRDLKKVTNITIGDSVERVSNAAFDNDYMLQYVDFGDAVISIGEYVLQDTPRLIQIIVPDTLNDIALQSFGNGDLVGRNIQIICRGDKVSCSNIYEKLSEYSSKKGQTYDATSQLFYANYEQCASTSYFWDGAKCVREPDLSKRKCCSSCKDMGGWCNRIQYTPAEAAPLLHNDNTNEVTITFKK